jgi:hypothetical protein
VQVRPTVLYRNSAPAPENVPLGASTAALSVTFSRFFVFQEKPTMTHQHSPTALEPLFLDIRETRKSLGNMGETSFWALVRAGVIPLDHIGKKGLVPYPAVKEVGAMIRNGALAPDRKAFKNHELAISKSIASRRRKAQVRADSAPAQVAAKHRNAPAGEPSDPPPDRSRRPP